MSHPYHHALSSAKTFGGQPTDYRAVHDLLDSSKACFAGRAHRAVLHHTDAIPLLVAVLHTDTVVTSDGADVSVDAIVRQHLREDCGGNEPTLDAWLTGLDPASTPLATTAGGGPLDPMSLAMHTAGSAEAFGGEPADYEALHTFMDLLSAQDATAHDPRRQLVTHHAFGCFLAEQAFGWTLTTTRGRLVPVRTVAERHITRALAGPIPSVGDWVQRLTLTGLLAWGAQRLSAELAA